MTAEFYADQYKRYATYCRNYGSNRLVKIAGGPNTDDYHWMETLMKNVPSQLMAGVSLHYYTLPGTWEKKGSATQFSEDEYFSTVSHTLLMEELVTRHSAIMDQYDPLKKVGLAVDEWGTWYDVEPGTNPGFLFQQNSLRDAIIAGINLNIFNNHCDRVKMANIAQLANVLQSVIFTDGDKLLLTPTFYVFEMYKVHQDAALIPLRVYSPDYVLQGKKIPAVTASASRNKSGVIHITFTNADPHNNIEQNIDIRGFKAGEISGTLITAKALNAYNTFSNPEVVTTTRFADYKNSGNMLHITLPPASVVMIEIK
jgi:alpha-N-arabinofuranosidase